MPLIGGAAGGCDANILFVLEKSVEVAGTVLLARADGTLFWPERSALFVADVHLGKAASFRAASVAVPVGTTAATLEKLSEAIVATSPSRLVFLGDLWHAKEGRREEIITSLSLWRRRFSSVEMTLVEGNHDRRAGALPECVGIEEVREPWPFGPFALCHYPCEVEGYYCLSGHIHPSVALSGKAKQSLRLPCFWFGAHAAVLPAFGEFTGTAAIAPRAGDRVLAIADQHLHCVRL